MKILVVSPHPDDETLGAGGSLLRYKSEGNKIYWLNITNMKIEYGFCQKQIEKRQKEIERVIRAYNFDDFFDLGLCPAKLEQYESDSIIKKISTVISSIEPDTIILPYKSDVHSDHGIVFNWCYSCTKIFRYPYIKRILAMEILSETDFALPEEKFAPNYFIDISDFLDMKIEILNMYDSEVSKHPFPRSNKGIKSLATLRGISAGTNYAEAFNAIKIID